MTINTLSLFKWLLLAVALVVIGAGRVRPDSRALAAVPVAASDLNGVTLSSSPADIGFSQATAAVTPTLEPGVLYQDDFISPVTGWPNAIKFDNYYIGYHEPSYYHLEVSAPHAHALATAPKKTFTDVSAETNVFVEVPSTAPNGDFRYGLVFRRSGDQYYAFAMSPHTKRWSVLKSSPTAVQELLSGNSEAIGAHSVVDMLRVDAQGSHFIFQINEQRVGEVEDATYSNGEVGFYVETFDSPRAHIHFDTLSVREIQIADFATATPTRRPPTPIPPTRTPTRRPPPPVLPTQTPDLSFPPDVYVTNLTYSPGAAKRNQDVTITATFLNTTGGAQPFRWLILLFDPNKPGVIKGFGESSAQSITVLPGSSQFSITHRAVTGPGGCVNLYMIAAWKGNGTDKYYFVSTGGLPVVVYFDVCP